MLFPMSCRHIIGWKRTAILQCLCDQDGQTAHLHVCFAPCLLLCEMLTLPLTGYCQHQCLHIDEQTDIGNKLHIVLQ